MSLKPSSFHTELSIGKMVKIYRIPQALQEAVFSFSIDNKHMIHNMNDRKQNDL